MKSLDYIRTTLKHKTTRLLSKWHLNETSELSLNRSTHSCGEIKPSYSRTSNDPSLVTLNSSSSWLCGFRMYLNSHANEMLELLPFLSRTHLSLIIWFSSLLQHFIASFSFCAIVVARYAMRRTNRAFIVITLIALSHSLLNVWMLPSSTYKYSMFIHSWCEKEAK